eukprot:m.28639 g.28639  ORF g.28639 m.28639 type:complete len:205 (-) comp9058_c0_seq1:241-855(-)
MKWTVTALILLAMSCQARRLRLSSDTAFRIASDDLELAANQFSDQLSALLAVTTNIELPSNGAVALYIDDVTFDPTTSAALEQLVKQELFLYHMPSGVDAQLQVFRINPESLSVVDEATVESDQKAQASLGVRKEPPRIAGAVAAFFATCVAVVAVGVVSLKFLVPAEGCNMPTKTKRKKKKSSSSDPEFAPFHITNPLTNTSV